MGLFAVQLGSSFKCVDEILECDHSNESYCRSSTFPLVLFIMLYKVVLTYKSLDEILKCDWHLVPQMKATFRVVLFIML